MMSSVVLGGCREKESELQSHHKSVLSCPLPTLVLTWSYSEFLVINVEERTDRVTKKKSELAAHSGPHGTLPNWGSAF